MKEVGLTAPQFSTLSRLAGLGSLTVGELAERLGTEQSILTRNLQVMAQKGWIATVTNPDARVHAYDVTDPGRRLNAALPLWLSFQQGLVARLGPDGAQRLLAALQELSTSAKTLHLHPKEITHGLDFHWPLPIRKGPCAGEFENMV